MGIRSREQNIIVVGGHRCIVGWVIVILIIRGIKIIIEVVVLRSAVTLIAAVVRRGVRVEVGIDVLKTIHYFIAKTDRESEGGWHPLGATNGVDSLDRVSWHRERGPTMTENMGTGCKAKEKKAAL